MAPYAADLLPVESNAAVSTKQNERPAEDIINKTRLPYRSTVYENSQAPNHFHHDHINTHPQWNEGSKHERNGRKAPKNQG